MNGGYLIMINLSDVVEFIEDKNNIKLTHAQKLVLENMIHGNTVYTPRCVGRSLLYNGYTDYLKEKVEKCGGWIPLFESDISGWNPDFAGNDPIGGYMCSVCKEEAIYDCNDKFVLSKFCPNCGAKMDEEVHNGKS